MTNKPFTLINAMIIDPENDHQGMGSLSIENGLIQNINGEITGEKIDCKGTFLAPGIIDMGIKICEPGEKHKESFKSAAAAAAAGGVTTMVTRPDTNPTIDTPEILEFFMKRAEQVSPIKIFPMAALTKKLEGEEITEMAFLSEKGAIAFTNGLKQISNPKIFLNALKYASDLDSLIIGHPQDAQLSKGAAATSGAFATLQGLPSVSTIAERLGIDRDIALVENTNVKYHADQITSGDGLQAIRNAKKRGLNITAGTSIHHLILNEYDIANYRTFFKLSPPLRSEKDRLEIMKGVIEEDLDTISSFHSPQDEESKRLPYEVAASGSVGLETLLPACLKLVHDGHLSLPKLFRLISSNPAKILGIKTGHLKKNYPADLILFEKDVPFIMDRFKLFSKSKNTPFDEMTMQGKVIATLVNGKTIFKNNKADIMI